MRERDLMMVSIHEDGYWTHPCFPHLDPVDSQSETSLIVDDGGETTRSMIT